MRTRKLVKKKHIIGVMLIFKPVNQSELQLVKKKL